MNLPKLVDRETAIMQQTSEQHPLPTYECFRTIDRIRVDGTLDERTWKHASAMRLTVWKDGSAPERETRVKMVWDTKNLYLAYWVEDDSFRCKMRKRDDPLWLEEVVEFFCGWRSGPAGLL
jgi:hypothetical protein